MGKEKFVKKDGKDGEGRGGGVGVTIEDVEDIARDDRCKGHESPVCREAVDAEDLH